ncbi:E3 ubiquitin-protein ligase TRAIP [Protopterus annectens]|uniref:E3 ubiquitin-protein ligase TRAIP n=1 Tax=Protopterus annectens TaxID=7888 RepID=UPI001CFB317A|nr:E3 ubiquitin-protein ligase TRAIP [Protopterus annectens]
MSHLPPCLSHWFRSAPSKTCPQCRIQVSAKQIISKLYFDVGGEESQSPDAESLQNELDRLKAQLSMKDKEKREYQSIIDTLRDSLDQRNAIIESLRKELGESDMLCSALRKQLKYLEQQQDEFKAAKEEARRLRTKMKTMESVEALLQAQRPEVEEMIHDMGVGPSAVEQLTVYCVSLKKEYDNLREIQKASSDLTEKLKRELFGSNNKLQKTTLELNKVMEDFQASQEELRNTDKEIMSLKKKIEFLQRNLSTPSRTNEAISRLVLESPAPLGIKRPCLRPPANSDEIDLNMTFDIETPEHVSQKCVMSPAKVLALDAARSASSILPFKPLQEKNKKKSKEDDDVVFPILFGSSMFKKKQFGSMLEAQKNSGMVRTGFDGLGGRTKFIEPTNMTEIRPLAMKAKRKKVSRPVASAYMVAQPKLDSFLKKGEVDPDYSCANRELDLLPQSPGW